MIFGKDFGLLALRVGAGLIVAGHGYTKLAGGKDAQVPDELTALYGPDYATEVQNMGMDNFTGFVQSLGFPMPKESAKAAAIAETIGGIGMALGAGTRLSSAAVLGTMIGAQKAHKGLIGENGGETPFLIGTAAAAVLLAGPGKFSVDAIMDGND